MQIANETGQVISYTISAPGMVDCGTIAIGGLADFPGYDNQLNVQVSVLPLPGAEFAVTFPTTQTDEQAEIALVCE